MRQIHGTSIRGKTAGSLIIFGVESALYGLWLAPFAFIILVREEDVARLCPCNTTEFIAQSIVSGGREIESIPLISCEDGAEVGASGIEFCHFLDGIVRPLFFPFRSHLGGKESISHQDIIWHRVIEQFKLGKGTLVFPILQQETGIVEAIIERSDIISQRIAIGRDSLLRAGDMAIAVCHLQCSLSA